MDARTRAKSSIETAQAELSKVLLDLDQIRTVNPALVGVVAHALSNYITVTAATVEMLQLALRDCQDPDVPIWLAGIGHATDLMQHSVGRLVTLATPRDFPLKLDYVNLPVMMERASEYFRRRAGAERLQITCRTIGQVPLAWGDRVALGVVADNLFSHAVRVSKPHGTIRVQVMAEPGYVTCSIADAGPGLTPEQRAALFQPIMMTALDASGNGDQMGALGLAIALEFVRRMDGDLWCESDGVQGAVLSFRLPALE